jgi:hypothetical protein
MALENPGMMNFPANLEDFLAEGVPDEVLETDPASFAVPDKELANRLCRRAATVRRLLVEDENVALAEEARIRRWLDARTERAQRELTWIGRSLEAYARQVGRPTVDLPNGKLRLRPAQPRTVVSDEEAAVAWLAEHFPDGVETKRTVRKAVVKDEFKGSSEYQEGIDGGEAVMIAPLTTADGEIVPGVVLEKPVVDRTFTWEAR